MLLRVQKSVKSQNIHEGMVVHEKCWFVSNAYRHCMKVYTIESETEQFFKFYYE